MIVNYVIADGRVEKLPPSYAAEADASLEELSENWNPNDYNITVRRALLNRDKSEILNAINDNQTMRNALQLSEERA